MADHAQDQILDAVEAIIKAAATAAANDVYVEPVDPVPVKRGQWVVIEAGEEEIPPGTSIGFPRVQNRGFRFDARCTVARKQGYRKAAGSLARDVEKALCASREIEQLNGLARNGVHLTGSSVEKDGEGEKAVYAIVLHWLAGYQTRANAPDAPI